MCTVARVSPGWPLMLHHQQRSSERGFEIPKRPAKHWNSGAHRFESGVPSTVSDECSNGVMRENLGLRSPATNEHATAADSLLEPCISGFKEKGETILHIEMPSSPCHVSQRSGPDMIK